MTEDRSRVGYKQTEIGIIPENWNVKYIGDIADVKTGPFGSVLHERDYVKDGTPIITVEHLNDMGVEHVNLPMVSDKDRIKLKIFSLKAGDIVFSRVGSIDRNALIRDSESGWLFSGRLLRVRLNSLKDHPNYLSYHFHSEPFKSRVREVAVGQTMPSLNTKILKGIQVIIPTEEEQRSIAQALSDVDTLIAALDKLITKKRNLKTATMQQLLTGKKRLPGFGEGKGYKQTSIGVIPEDWDIKAVGDICDFIVPGRNKPKNFDGDIPWITTPDLDDGRNVSESKLGLFISRDEAKSVGSKIVPSGAIIMSCVGELGIVAFVEREIVINQQLHAFIPSLEIEAFFLLNVLQTQKYFMLSIATLTAVPYLNKDNCNSIPIPLPSYLEQQAIANVLSDMDTEITAIETRLTKTQAIKQGMMQELLTGRTRLI